MHEKRLYAKFLTDAILVEQGRLLYALLYAFSRAGYQIELFDGFAHHQLGRCGKLVPDMPGVTMTQAPPSHPERSIYLYDVEDASLAALAWAKKVRINDDIFSPYCGKYPMILPYAMHPRQTGGDLDEKLARLRTQRRTMRIFFSGDTKDYGRNRIRYPAPKLPRLEIVNILKERLADHVALIQEVPARDRLLEDERPYIDRCVIMDTSRIWIEEPDWLDTLARSDFFLSPPGIVMPMCHNIIEAMAVGTIPITNYPEWLRPNLVHMQNCIVFDDEADLIRKVQLALSLNESEIARMRANVIDYYRKHLDPRTFVGELEARPERNITVLLYTENNVRDNWARLNRHSVLIRKSNAVENPGRITCLVYNLLSNVRTLRRMV